MFKKGTIIKYKKHRVKNQSLFNYYEQIFGGVNNEYYKLIGFLFQVKWHMNLIML